MFHHLLFPPTQSKNRLYQVLIPKKKKKRREPTKIVDPILFCWLWRPATCLSKATKGGGVEEAPAVKWPTGSDLTAEIFVKKILTRSFAFWNQSTNTPQSVDLPLSDFCSEPGPLREEPLIPFTKSNKKWQANGKNSLLRNNISGTYRIHWSSRRGF